MDDAVQPWSPGWTFLTSHARVLAAIARDPGVRVRDIADRCLLTERAVQKIIADLEEAGYLHHTRVGRSNRYTIQDETPLRHPADTGPTVADLLALLAVQRRAESRPDESTGGARNGEQGGAPGGKTHRESGGPAESAQLSHRDPRPES